MVDSGVDSEPSPSSPDSDVRSTSSPTPQLTTTQSQPTTKSSKDPTSKNPATKSRKSVPSKRVAHSPSGAPNLPTMMSCMSEAPLRLTQPVNLNNHNNSNDFSEGEEDKMSTVEALLSLSDTSRSADNSPEKSQITILPAHNPDKERAICGRCQHPLIALEPHTCKSTPPPPLTVHATAENGATLLATSRHSQSPTVPASAVAGGQNLSAVVTMCTSSAVFSHLQTAITAAAAGGQIPGESSLHVQCTICKKDFANVYRLQRHMISHDESSLLRRFKCTDCGKAFKFKHHLKEHVRIHTGDKPFECNHCGKRFSHSGSYSSHMTSKKCQGLAPGAKNQQDDTWRPTSPTNEQTMDEIVKKVVDSPPLSFSKPVSVIPDSIRSDADSPPLSTVPSAAAMSSLPPFIVTSNHGSSPPTISLASPSTLILSPTPFALNSLMTPDISGVSPPATGSISGLPTSIPGGLLKPDLLRKPLPTEALLANLSALRGVGGYPGLGLGSQEVTNLRLLLETVNLAVTRSLLEDNLMRWGAAAAAVANAQQQQHQQLMPEKLSGVRHNSYDSDCTSDDEGGMNSPSPYLLEPDIEMREEKKSRVRSLISDEQLNILRSCYNINPMPKKEELMQIADAIGHPYKVVKVWFQNSRARDRREGKSISLNIQQPTGSSFMHKYPTPPPSIGSLLQSPGSTPSPQPLPTLMPNAFPASSLPGSFIQRTSIGVNTTPTHSMATPLDLSTAVSSHSSNHYSREQLSPSVTPPPLVVAEPDDYNRMVIKEEGDNSSDTSDDEMDMNNDEQQRRNSFEAMIREKLVSLTPDQGVLRRSIGAESGGSAASGKENNERTEMAAGNGGNSNNGVEEVSGVYQCDLCDKTFNKKSSITRHKYEHSDLRPHKCTQCDKAFKHKHHLTEHRRLHSGEKPFQCPKCFKRFSHSGSYSQHINHRFSYCKPAASAVETNASMAVSTTSADESKSVTAVSTSIKMESGVDNIKTLLANGLIKLEPPSVLASVANSSLPMPEGVIKSEPSSSIVSAAVTSSAANSFSNLVAGPVRKAIQNAVQKTSFDVSNSQLKPVLGSSSSSSASGASSNQSKPVLSSINGGANIIVKQPMAV